MIEVSGCDHVLLLVISCFFFISVRAAPKSNIPLIVSRRHSVSAARLNVAILGECRSGAYYIQQRVRREKLSLFGPSLRHMECASQLEHGRTSTG